MDFVSSEIAYDLFGCCVKIGHSSLNINTFTFNSFPEAFATFSKKSSDFLKAVIPYNSLKWALSTCLIIMAMSYL